MAITCARCCRQGRPIVPRFLSRSRGASNQARVRGPCTVLGESAASTRGARDGSGLLQDGRQEGQPRCAAGGGDAGNDPERELSHRIVPVTGLHRVLLGH